MRTYYQIGPQLYDDQFWWKTDDIEFWKSTLDKNHSILELACGTGRIAIPLIKEGFNYCGIDISLEYVNHANKKMRALTDKQLILQGDMRTFKHHIEYDSIFIGFNSFLHLLDERNAKRCLSNIKQHLHKSSIVYIDMFVPHPLFLFRPRNHKVHIMDFYDSTIKDDVYIKENIQYNPETEIADVVWHYYKEKNTLYNTFKFKMKMFYPDTMNRILIDSGFYIDQVWGSYNYSKFNENSNLQIYKCLIN